MAAAAMRERETCRTFKPIIFSPANCRLDRGKNDLLDWCSAANIVVDRTTYFFRTEQNEPNRHFIDNWHI
jgi:hypothetical protein